MWTGHGNHNALIGPIVFPTYDGRQIENADWLADVDYWKQSVPSGGQIGEWGANAITIATVNVVLFGVTNDWQYMSGVSEQVALQSIHAAANPISPSYRKT